MPLPPSPPMSSLSLEHEAMHQSAAPQRQLPVAQSAPRRMAPVAALPVSVQTAILVAAEDEAMGQRLVRSLHKLHCTIASCRSLETARAQLDQHDFAAVLVDLRGGDQLAQELCLEIRQQRPGVRLVAVVASDTYESVLAAMRAGASDSLSQPLSAAKLAEVVDRASCERAARRDEKSAAPPFQRLRAVEADAERASGLLSLDGVERNYIAHVMQVVAGNRTHASRILGIDRATLLRKLDRYGLRELRVIPS